MRDAFGKIREKLKTGDLCNAKQVIDTYISKILVYPKSVGTVNNYAQKKIEPFGKEEIIQQ